MSDRDEFFIGYAPPMPFGVIRFRNVHASWVNAVGMNARSFFTQPSSAVAHDIGTSG